MKPRSRVKWIHKKIDKLKRFGKSPKKIIIPLSENAKIRIKLYTEYGKGRIFKFLYQLEVLLNGKWYAVARYDNFHGFCHKNILNKKGEVVQLERIEGTDFKIHIEIAEKDLRENYLRYISDFNGSD